MQLRFDLGWWRGEVDGDAGLVEDGGLFSAERARMARDIFEDVAMEGFDELMGECGGATG